MNVIILKCNECNVRNVLLTKECDSLVYEKLMTAV